MSASELFETDPWKIAWGVLAPHARARVEAEFPAGEPPAFAGFLFESLEADASGGRASLRSTALLESGLVIRALADTNLLPTPDAIRLATAAARLDPRLDAKLLAHLTRPERIWPDEVPELEVARVLEILDAISDCHRLIMPLMKFLKLRQAHLRSKVVKLIARASQNPGWADMLLADSDPRVRSNLIEGLARQESPNIVELLQRAAKDPHHRVSVTALLELCRRNLTPGCAELRRLAAEGDPQHRTAANWAIRQLDSAAPPAAPQPEPESPPAPEPAPQSK